MLKKLVEMDSRHGMDEVKIRLCKKYLGSEKELTPDGVLDMSEF